MRIVFPSLNFRVTGTVGEGRTTSSVESVLVRLVSDGFATVEDLGALLGLPLRRTITLVGEMISRGILAFDLDTGRLSVPRPLEVATLEAASDPNLRAGRTRVASVEVREFELSLNRCTGGVAPARMLGSRGNRGNSANDGELTFSPQGGLIEIDTMLEANVRTAINAIVGSEGLHVIDIDLESARITREGGLFATVNCLEAEDGENGVHVSLEFDGQGVRASEKRELETAVQHSVVEQAWFWARLKTIEDADASRSEQRPDKQPDDAPAMSPTVMTGTTRGFGKVFDHLRDLKDRTQTLRRR